MEQGSSAYSRLEKDFIGNERMVNYDAQGNLVSISEVVREPDGTLRVLPAVPTTIASSPDSQIPTPQSAPNVESINSKTQSSQNGYPRSMIYAICIATCIISGLITTLIIKNNESEKVQIVNVPAEPSTPQSSLADPNQLNPEPNPGPQDSPPNQQESPDAPVNSPAPPFPDPMSPPADGPASTESGPNGPRPTVENPPTNESGDLPTTAPQDSTKPPKEPANNSTSSKPLKKKEAPQKPKPKPTDPVDLGRDDG
jgi:hypothetical protein